MSTDILDLIYEKYICNCLDCKADENGEILEKFKKKYVKPLIKKNYRKGIEMDEMLNDVLAESDVQAFKNGFKTCMNFMLEYVKGDI